MNENPLHSNKYSYLVSYLSYLDDHSHLSFNFFSTSTSYMTNGQTNLITKKQNALDNNNNICIE